MAFCSTTASEAFPCEDAGVLELPISLSRSVDYPVTLEFFTRGGEIRDFATPGVDYEEIRLDVRFDPGETENTMVPISTHRASQLV